MAQAPNGAQVCHMNVCDQLVCEQLVTCMHAKLEHQPCFVQHRVHV